MIVNDARRSIRVTGFCMDFGLQMTKGVQLVLVVKSAMALASLGYPLFSYSHTFCTFPPGLRVLYYEASIRLGRKEGACKACSEGEWPKMIMIMIVTCFQSKVRSEWPIMHT
jgi:hypothetical protein